MKLSEYIKHLEKVRAQRAEDPDVIISVRDHYGRYGRDATPSINTDGALWDGVMYNGNGQLRLDVHLMESEGKSPKITFR